MSGSDPRGPRTAASAARVGAARALLAVEEGAHLDDALADCAPAEGADRDLAWFLAFGVTRRRGHVDAALRPVLTRPIASLDPAVRVAVRLGVYERLYARTPAHAAVHQAVEVARAIGAGRASGLVNAVVRRAALPAELAEADALDHPSWLVDRWKRRYGAEPATAWLVANAEPAPLFVVAKTDDAVLPPEVVPTGVPRVFRATVEGRIPELPGFREGHWWVQDLAAVEVADLVQAAPGMRVLDACAAPGGKSFRLASQGASVFAADRDARRLADVSEGARRLGLTVPTRVHDWTKGGIDERFDAVLVDAPCTGLGTVRRHPEIRWRRSEQDLAKAQALQRQILGHAAESVRPGGALVYAVCSPEPEEGEAVVDAFLAEHPSYEPEARLSTAPPAQGEDAHFAVRLRRRA